MQAEWTHYLVVTLLLLCAASDARANKIPNIITMPFAALAVVLHSFDRGLDGFLFSISGMAAGIGFLVIFYMMGGMGAGDVKLMGAVGSFLGVQETFEAFVFSALVGGIYSLLLILIRRDVFKGFLSEKLQLLISMVLLKQFVPIQTESLGQKPRLKYGIAIALGTITYLILKSFGIKFLI
jgi:prepilin peptidase CpaA